MCPAGFVIGLSYRWGSDPRHVDYGAVYNSRLKLLSKAKKRGWERDREEVTAFVAENARWLPDYALFMACKRHFGMRSWTEWEDEDIRLRRSQLVLEQYRTLLREDVELFTYIQYLFFRQWVYPGVGQMLLRLLNLLLRLFPLVAGHILAHGPRRGP